MRQNLSGISNHVCNGHWCQFYPFCYISVDIPDKISVLITSLVSIIYEILCDIHLWQGRALRISTALPVKLKQLIGWGAIYLTRFQYKEVFSFLDPENSHLWEKVSWVWPGQG